MRQQKVLNGPAAGKPARLYDYLVNQVNRLGADPTAAIHPPKQDKVLPKYLTAEQSMELLKARRPKAIFRSGIIAW